jgi:hypothetical protein
MQISRIIICLFYFFLILPCKSQHAHNGIIEFGTKRELFVDHSFIENLNGAGILMHHPHDEGIVMYFDKPWEGNFSIYTTIIKDGDLYRAYYRGVREAGSDNQTVETTCYAESDDGITWTKPGLRLYEVNGTRENNVILANAAPVTHNFSPFIDTNPKAEPNQKYKAVGGSSATGLVTYGSPDGIHWHKLSSEGIIKKGAFDSQNIAFWSEAENRYVSYFRIFSKGYRSVARAVSEDFKTWSEPVEMTYGNTQPEQIYTQQTSPYFRAPHIYIAIGARFLPGRQVLNEEQARKINVNPGYFKDLSEAIFMTTRGGNVYDRTFMEAFIRPGIGLGNWVSRTNYPALNVVQTGPEEISIYVNQDYAQPSSHLRRYSLRIDGFTSLNAPFSGGTMVTKLFTFSGTNLEINYSTSAAGEIRFELQDEQGRPFKGYSIDECQPVLGNEIERIVTWKGGEDISKLSSKTVRMKIWLKDADLYSFRFK